MGVRLNINPSNLYGVNISGIARLSGGQPESVFNSKVIQQFRHINRPSGVHTGVYGGKAKSKRWLLGHFLKISVEMTERTDTGRLFRREGAHE